MHSSPHSGSRGIQWLIFIVVLANVLQGLISDLQAWTVDLLHLSLNAFPAYSVEKKRDTLDSRITLIPSLMELLEFWWLVVYVGLIIDTRGRSNEQYLRTWIRKGAEFTRETISFNDCPPTLLKFIIVW
jgi:hypothetical protein